MDYVNDLIHDFLFDVEKITMVNKTLVIPFERKPIGGSRKDAAIPSRLLLHHVRDSTIEDTQRIALYDFNILRYDPSRGTITVETGVPMKFQVGVERLEVSVEIGPFSDTGNP